MVGGACMLKQLGIGTDIISVGDQCRVTVAGKEYGLGEVDSILTIEIFKLNGKEEVIAIGMKSPTPIYNRSSLGGRVPMGQGLWIPVGTFQKHLTLIDRVCSC